MTIKLEVDVAWDTPIGDFLKDIETYNGKIVSAIADGPGGGNPCLTLDFVSLEKAKAWFELAYQGDDFDIHLVKKGE